MECAAGCVLVYVPTYAPACGYSKYHKSRDTAAFILPLKEAIESSLVYMLLSRRQEKYRLSYDSKTWSSCLHLSKLLLQQSQQVESLFRPKKRDLQRQPQECMWSRGGSNVARGPKRPPHVLLLHSGAHQAEQHSQAVFVERAGWLPFAPLLSLACLSGRGESRRGCDTAASPSITTFKFHFLSQPFFLVANYHLLQDVKNILPGINC